MSEDNTTNLPILDDIIKPGDTDKAVHRPANRVQSPVRPEEHTSDPVSALPEADPVSPVPSDAPTDTVAQRTDIDALTEEILASVRDDIDQVLRLKIRQVLERRFSDDSKSD
ncbi:MAG: hypothetical protein JSW45_00110 [Thiotrichales bacterium]|nr:MAG: hypothetical protein JSW45_00110 [Thiotrichales bacterium]